MSAAQIEALLERARALNLVDVIHNNQDDGNTSLQVIGGRVVKGKRRKKTFAEQYLRYVIAVDFEATCWAGRKATPQEIIEFPAVLYNLKTQKIEDEFQTYVRPTENKKISPYCTELTGITQETVDAGLNIKNALNDFHDWLLGVLQKHGLTLPKFNEDDINGNVAFVTWGDWDFGTCLKRELLRKAIKRPVYYNHWSDIRSLYLKHYKCRPRSFSDSLAHLNMPFQGRAHSGIDDARNLAHLCGRMAQDGHLITITADLCRNKFVYRPLY